MNGYTVDVTLFYNRLFVVAGFLLTLAASFGIYFGFNKGMARKARGQQTRRFAIAALLAWAPLAMVGASPLQLPIVLAWVVGMIWVATYPALFHLTNRRLSPDYENYGEIACGIYFFGIFSALWLAGGGVVAALMEWLVLMVSIVLVGYYLLYGSCINANGMKIVQDTHYNEILEFGRSYKWYMVVLVVGLVVGLLTVCVAVNTFHVSGLWQTEFFVTVALFFAWYVFKPHRGMFVRSGIVALWLTIRDYRRGNMRYREEMAQRISRLTVRQRGEAMGEPHTVVMVIGESASRDHMSAFTPMDHDTTPWLRELMHDDRHAVGFPHAYSCAMHTVQVLEKSLTEYNQYNGRQFYDSCSIVDIAHRLGYRVHWYSNQGHLGAADTPVTLVAETADVAKWTKQDLGKVQYDEELLGYLDELDPTCNNLLVLHLKGSHFNFLNRYPADRTVWGEPEREDHLLNYHNSLRYTDGVLQRAFDYCRERLNLQAWVYCSDHATVPDRHRSPNFSDFGDTRIPLVCWMSDAWQQLHPGQFEALRQNRDCYWTNDLLYELMCGVLDVESEHYDETASLASPRYRFTRDELLTFEGQLHISDDKKE